MGEMQAFLERHLSPLARKLDGNKYLKAITAGLMSTLSLTICAAVFSLISSFPYQPVVDYLNELGLVEQINAIPGATLNLLAVFIVFSIAYNFAKNEKINALPSGIFALVTFVALMPQTIKVGDTAVSALSYDYMGSKGIFVAMIVAVGVASIYVTMVKKKIVLKLPESVPPMVAQSFSPIIIIIVIGLIALIVRILFNLTSYGDIFNFVNTVVTTPVLKLGGSPIALIVLFTFINLLWFFGIHPAAVQSVIIPIVITMVTGDIALYQAGQSMQYVDSLVVFSVFGIGGTGCTLGLVLSMLLTGKSERYKSMLKIGGLPNLFNINEPIMFGMPVILNPLLFFPLVFSSVVSGGIALVFLKLGFLTTINPTFGNGIGLPWTTPFIVSPFFTGIKYVIVMLVCLIAVTLLYLPFFKILDNQALAEEKAAATANA